MTEVPPSLLSQVYQYGALPLLLLALYILWKKADTLEIKLDKLHATHKTDLKNHAEEVKSLHQDTLTVVTKIQNND